MRRILNGVAAVVLACSIPAAAQTMSDAVACITVKYRSTPVCFNKSVVCTETPQSSFIRAVCYDAAASYMLINLDGVWYHYCAVDSASVHNLIHASSPGTYYNQNFRSHGSLHGPYDCRDHPVPY